MATRVELPKDIVHAALIQASSLRARQIKASSNAIIQQALQQEELAINNALLTLSDIPEKSR